MNRFHRCYCASPGWAHLVHTTVVPAVLEGTELGRRVLEIGPGPGLTTEILARVAPQLTAIEIDPTLAKATRDRVPAARVVQGDATRMPFPDGAFSAVVCLTMLHHLPVSELQDRLFVEAHRVLGPGGVFCGSDNPGRGPRFRLIHIGDNGTIGECTWSASNSSQVRRPMARSGARLAPAEHGFLRRESRRAGRRQSRRGPQRIA